MNLAIDYSEGYSVISSTIDLPKAVTITEARAASFVYKPDGADKLSVEKVRPVVDNLGIFRTEIIQKVDFRYERQLELFSHDFSLSCDEGNVLIFSRQWPLSGQGENIRAAISDLLSTIRDLKAHYAHISIDQLDGRAVIFRDYILSLNI